MSRLKSRPRSSSVVVTRNRRTLKNIRRTSSEDYMRRADVESKSAVAARNCRAKRCDLFPNCRIQSSEKFGEIQWTGMTNPPATIPHVHEIPLMDICIHPLKRLSHSPDIRWSSENVKVGSLDIVHNIRLCNTFTL
jgi:hypothetical protein